MQRVDGKKSLASIILVEQGNKKAYTDIVRLYEGDIYFLCGRILGFKSELKNCVTDIFVKFYDTIENVDRSNFENCLYTFAIRYCSDYVRKNTKDYSFGTKYPVKTEDCELSADDLAQLYRKKEKWQNPDKRAISFWNEMLMNMPVQSKIIFSYLFYTDLSYTEIAEIEGASEEQIKSTAVFGYSYLSLQAKRAVLIHLNLLPSLEYLPYITDCLASVTKAPMGLRDAVSEKIGVLELVENNEPIREQEDEYPKIEKKKFDKIRIIRIIINIAIILILVGLFLFVKFSVADKNKNISEIEVSEEADNQWDGTVATSFESGDGTQQSPYVIADASQLAYFSQLINSGNTEYFAAYYVLGNDIVFNDISNFKNWGTQPPENNYISAGYINDNENYKYFCGNFNGNGHTITGLYCNADICAGLFGYVSDGVIKNVTLENAYIVSSKYAGGVAGYFKSSSANTGIYNCTVSGKICSDNYTGGIAGYCNTKGENSSFVISECENRAEILCKKSSAGGITGFLQSDAGKSEISNCLNIGNISAVDNAGGIAGVQQLTKGNCVIKLCINAGIIECVNNTTGAIAGICDCVDVSSFAEIYKCFYLDVTSASAASEGDNTKINANALSADDFSDKTNFPEFDFEKIWEMNSVMGMPILRPKQ